MKKNGLIILPVLVFCLSLTGCVRIIPSQPQQREYVHKTNADRILAAARTQLGTPYRSGGTTPGRGFDCSGFVQWVYKANAYTIPRTTREQASIGRKVSRSDLRPGDILVFRTGLTSLHTAIYTDCDGIFIHSPNKGGRVRYDDINDSYWARNFLYGRRLPGVS